MSPAVRKFVLTAHIAVSVGWVGALSAYLALDLAAVTTDDAVVLRAAYVAMDVLVRLVIVPLAVASLGSGVVVSLGTKWGLFRHYWVLVSLVLTSVATVVLLLEARTVRAFAVTAGDPATSAEALSDLGGTLPHSVGGLLLLLGILTLNMYKPRGLTRYGWRKQQQERGAPAG